MPDCSRIYAQAEHSEKRGIYETAIQTYYEAAECFRRLGKEKNAKNIFKKIIKIAEKKGRNLIKNHKYLPAGIVYYFSALSKKKMGVGEYQDEIDEAMKALTEGVEFYQKNKQYSDAARCALELGKIEEQFRGDRSAAIMNYARAAELYANAGDYMDAIAMIDETILYYSDIGDEEKINEFTEKLNKYINEGIFSLSSMGNHKEAGLLAMRVAKDAIEKNAIKDAIDALYKSLDEFLDAEEVKFSRIVFIALSLYHIAENSMKKLDKLINDYSDEIIDRELVDKIKELTKAIKDKDISVFGNILSYLKEQMENHPIAMFFYRQVSTKLPSISISVSKEREVLPIDDSELITVSFENTYNKNVTIERATITTTEHIRANKKELTTPIKLKMGAVYVETFEIQAIKNGTAEISIHSEIEIDAQRYKIKTKPILIKVPALKPEIEVSVTSTKQIKENIILAEYGIRNVGEGKACDVTYNIFIPNGIVVGKGFIKDNIGDINVDNEKKIEITLIIPTGVTMINTDIAVTFSDEDENVYEREFPLTVKLESDKIKEEEKN